MQAAAELVALVRELAPGVQGAEDNLDTGQFLLRVQIDRHAAAIIPHAERAITMQHNVDLTAVPRQRLVDRVVDDFLSQVIGAGGVGIHAGTLADRLQTSQDFNSVSVVFGHFLLQLV